MGYTHYWNRPETLDQKAFDLWVGDVEKIILEGNVPLGDYEGKPGSRPTINRKVVGLNGVGDAAHETFYIDRVMEVPEYQRSEHPTGPFFAFCKTARKDYDSVVTASLIALHDRFGETISISSDGEWAEWMPGRALYEKAIGKEPVPPPKVTDDE